MKTTIDLSNDLFAKFKKRTATEGISMRTAMHEALHLWLKTSSSTKPPRISSNIGLAKGKGLQPQAAGKTWDELRELSYHDPI